MSTLWMASLVALWVVVGILTFLLLGALRQLGLMQLRLGSDPGALITDEGLDRGVRAPDFAALDAEHNAARRLSDFPIRPRVLVFLSPTCIACATLVPHLNEV